MTNDRAHVPLQLRCQFSCHNFGVVPALMGKTHEFVFNEKHIKIALPRIDEVGDAHKGNPKAICQSWFKVNDEHVPARYDIFRVDVKVILDQSPEIHPDMLKLNINQYELISKEEQNILNELCDSYFTVAAAAYEYWLAVLRWKTGDFRIGRSIIVGNASGRTPTLYAIEPDKAVWGSPSIFRVEGVHDTTEDDWSNANVALTTGTDVPAHISLLQDGQEYFRRHDFRRALIDIAIACEVYLRTRVLADLPKGIPPAVFESVEAINISQYFNKYFAELLSPDGKIKFKPLKDQLKSLFDARNKIMHMHNNERSTSDQCEKFIQLAQKLFELDNYLSTKNSAVS